jgi:hypothetical protein
MAQQRVKKRLVSISASDASGFQWLVRGRLHYPTARIAALFVVLLFLIPPDGMLSSNEEQYFQLAARSVGAMPNSPESAVFDSSPHRIIADHLMSWLIALLGYTWAQIFARVLAAVAYSVTLSMLFHRFALGTIEGVVIVIAFALLGQTLFADEGLFGGAEAKVPAYALVLAGLALTIDRKYIGAALLFVVATYFHFLVGIFWFFAAMALALVEDRSEQKRPLFATVVFLLLVAPLLGLIAWNRLVEVGPSDAEMNLPTPDVIYSLIRAPHHTAPFLDWSGFVWHWLGGYLLACGMLAGAFVVTRLPEGARLRGRALWLGLLLLYLILALIPAFIDRDTGALGKFYLFRPAALVLLLWLAVAASMLGTLLGDRRLVVSLVALALVTPPFLINTAYRIAGARAAWAEVPEKQALVDFLRARAPLDAIVLIDPELEGSNLDFERRTGNPSLVMWKFVPTNDPQILEWYRRIEFRKALFAQGCAKRNTYSPHFQLGTPEHAAQLAKTCGPIVYRSTRLVLLRRR